MLRTTTRVHLFPVTAVLILGAVLTLMLFMRMRTGDNEMFARTFELEAQESIDVLRELIDAHIQEVTSLGAFFASSERITGDSFLRFARVLLDRHQAVVALEWVPRVTSGERRGFEAELRGEGFGGSAISQRTTDGRMMRAPERSEYFPVQFAEPLPNNDLIVGFDLASDPIWAQALEEAIAEKHMVAARTTTLMQTGIADPGILIVKPVFRVQNMADLKMPDRREALKGFAGGVFHMQKILDAMARIHPSDIDVDLFDVSTGENNALLVAYTAKGILRAQTSSAALSVLRQQPYCHEERVDILGCALVAVCTPASNSRIAGHGWSSWLVLVFGFAITGVFALYIRANLSTKEVAMRTKERAEELNSQLKSKIAEQTRSAEALRDSEERFRSVFEQAAVGMCQCDLDGMFVRVNKPLCDSLGYGRDELSKMTFRAVTHPEDLAADERQVERLLKGLDSVYTMEKRYVRKDGTVLWGNLSVSLMRSATGEPMGFIGIVEDISRRKRAEDELQKHRDHLEELIRDQTAALRKSEEKYRGLHDSLKDGIVRCDKRGTILECNSAFREMLGYTMEELRMLTNADLTPARWREKEAEIVANQIVARGYSDEYEKEYIRKDGTVLPISTRVWLINDDAGRPFGMWGLVRDLTERIKAQQAVLLQGAIAANMAEGVLLTRAEDGIIIYTNDSLDRTFGYEPGELIGKPVTVLNAPSEVPPEEVAAKIMAQLSKTRAWRGEILNRKKDGTAFVCEVNVSTLDDPQHGHVWVAVHQDITERKRTEDAIRSLNAELEYRQAELQKANDELEAFVYSVSHDLRSPLRGVDGYSKLLLEDHAAELDEDGRFMLTQVRESAKQMGEMIDDLLTFSRMGRRDLQFQRCDISSIVRKLFAEMQHHHPGRRIRLELKELPVCEGDNSMIREVVQNLLENAIKFSRTCDESIIEIGALARDSDMVTYYVRDNGVGFDSRFGDKLFQVFQRLHRAEEFEGTGIGLAVVKRIVMRHGGQVWAESLPGGGATFYFSLPFLKKGESNL